MKIIWKILVLLSVALSIVSVSICLASKQSEIRADWIAIFCGITAIYIGILLYFNLTHVAEIVKHKTEEVVKATTKNEIDEIKEDIKKLRAEAEKIEKWMSIPIQE